MSLGGLLFSLGPNSVFHGVLYALFPLVDKSRVPAAGIILFAVGFAPLVAFGVDMLPRSESSLGPGAPDGCCSTFAAVLAFTSLILWAVEDSGGR